ncbi:MAG TPA: porin [Gemmataceae bacterium]|nr:porin [Gemmataceae bacterium]
MRIMKSGGFRWMWVVALAGVLAGWPAGARGQQGSPPLPPIIGTVAPPSDAHQKLLDRLRKMEQRLDQVTKQNEDLARDNKTLAEQVHELSRQICNPGRQGGMTGEPSGTATSGVTGAGDDGKGVSGSNGSESAGSAPGGESGKAGGSSDSTQPSATGGGSKASGGDPTTTGQAQEVGNLHLGKVSLKSSYDFDNGGQHWATQDDEYTFGIRGMTQLDGMIYERPTPGFSSGGFYNPRSRIYFEGSVTKPINYEFSFQNFYDSVALLDAYVNFDYDPRFQVRIGRYKTPFTYEFYRIHVWDLLAPERSLFATNYEANRRVGLMGWGALFDNRLEYAVGTFDTQRNSFRAFNGLQDVEAFLNFKPFYNREEGFLLRDIQVGGSVDAGDEDQSPVPAVLRTNRSPGADAFTSTAAGNVATVPFLAFAPNVSERGDRALWELHTAYYHGGLSLLGAWQSGYESYANGNNGPVRIPINGWFVQAGYILTGETIRDRTLIQPLHPFDLRKGHCGLGAFEPTARFSELDLSPRVFSAGLVDPTLWTDHARLVDVGLNWYLNQFVKIYFDWEHAMFGSPVFSNTGSFQKSNDLFWIRTQVYF